MAITLGKKVAPDAPAPPSVAAFALGFRPFFLLAGVHATLFVPLWLFATFGRVSLPTRLPGSLWHGHEMLYGFTVAVIAGFLLTAVRNWTNKPTPSGAPLAGLAVVWALGRVALLFDAHLPRGLAAAIDLAFLPLVALGIALPIVRAKNFRNLAFVPLLLVLFVANLWFHLSPDGASRALRVALDVVLAIVVVVGGRVIPMFTVNALSVTIPKRRALDWASLASVGLVALLEVLPSPPTLFALALVAAGALNLARVLGWKPLATRGRPILWVLHVAYGWLGLGLVLRGVGAFVPAWMPTASMHALTVGAIGMATLGMMTRVSLGHTGRMLAVSSAIAVAYGVLFVAAITRALGPLLLVAWYPRLLLISGVAWTIAFALFVLVYFPILRTPRIDGKPG